MHEPFYLAVGPGIGFSAEQDCGGDFNLQKVCVKLQELDYYGAWYNRTSYVCTAETVNVHTYKYNSVLCKDARQGTYRTTGKGYAYPIGSPSQNETYSTGPVKMCVGY